MVYEVALKGRVMAGFSCMLTAVCVAKALANLHPGAATFIRPTREPRLPLRRTGPETWVVPALA